MVSEFQKECRIIRQALEGDLCKVGGGGCGAGRGGAGMRWVV